MKLNSEIKINSEKNEIKSLSHSKYRCQYHIVFSTLF